jgi:flagellar motor switch/type III secretory pathway protein FliN
VTAPGRRRAPRAFPWRALESTTREEAAALRDARRWAQRSTELRAVPSTLSELLGAEVDVRVARAQPLGDVRPLEGGLGVVLARADAPRIARGALVEVERALASAMVARVMRRPPARVIDESLDPAAGLAGAFAAIVAAAARRAHAGAAPRVLAAGPATTLEADVARLDPGLFAITLTVLVAHDAFTARVVVRRDLVAAAPSRPWDAGSLAALGAAPLSIPIVACAVRATAADIGALRAGDVFLPGGWPLALAPGSGAATDAAKPRWAGLVLLAAPSADVGTRAQLGDDGRLVLRGDVEPLCAAEVDMSDGEAGGLVEAIGDVPVVVRVEIGEARMAAREWADLGRGDVIALGRRIGEPVVLRVGGVPIARGELVDIDGEVGVRIVERLAGETSS